VWREALGQLAPRRAGLGQARAFQGVVVLALLVAGIVGSSLAIGSTSSTSTTFESGIEPFTNIECPHPSTQLARVTSPVREGTYAERISETGSDVWSNGTVRCLLANYNSGETTGNDYYYHLSIFIPTGGLSQNLIWELHHPASLYNISPGCSVAPHALVSDGTQLLYRLFAGNCLGADYALHTSYAIPGLNPQPRNVWIDFVIHVRFAESSTGVVQVWYRTGSNPWPSSPQLNKTGVPTMPYSTTLGIHNVALWWAAGLYPGYSGYNRSDTIYLDDYRRETSLSAAEGGSAPAPAPAPPPAPTGTSSFSVASNLVDGQHFAATTKSAVWTATASGGTVSYIEFWVDGVHRWTEKSSPYQYNGDPSGLLDVSALSTGTHSLAVKAFASDGRSATKTITITRDAPTSAPPPPPAPTSTSSFSVSTNLVDGQHFATTTKSATWTATASVTVASVEFWVDGVRRWTEKSPPYQYNGDPSGLLDLSALSTGNHSLVVKAFTSDGRLGSKTITIGIG
jgi:hypothetical protein